MTVNTLNITSGPYVGNNLNDTYSYDFTVADKTQLSVYETTDLGVQSLLVVDTDYTVVDAGVDGGGTVVRVAGNLPTDYQWYIRSNYIANQLTAFPSQGPFFPEVHENQMDHLTFLIQQILDSKDRSFRLDDSIDIDGVFTIAQDAATRADLALGFDNAGNLVVKTFFDPSLIDQNDLDKRHNVTFATVAAMISASPIDVAGNPVTINADMTVETQGYNTAGDTGAAKYLIKGSQSVDEHGDHTLDNGNVAILQYSGKANVNQFGVFADGVTNWEASYVSKMTVLYDLSQTVGVYWPTGLYNTALNFTNKYQNIKMEFADGAEFGGLFHLVSSGTPVFSEPLSNVAIGVNPTITTASAHGMGSERYCSFEGTGTSLDGTSALVTPTGASTATVTATVTGTYTGPGSLSDIAIQNVILKGDFTTYDRFGTINVDGLIADRVICKSDTSKNTLGDEGGGVHIFTLCKNFNINEVIVEDTKNQAASANMHAAFACDGVGLESLTFGKVWVKDTKVNGAIIQGEGYHIGQLVVDRYGNGVMSSVIPYVGDQDLFSQTSATLAHGLWISRATGRIDHVVIDQKDGFSGRAFAQKDVVFDRDFLLWDSPQTTSFVDVKTGFSVGHIECKNPHYVAVDFGSYKGWCTPTVEKITLGIIDDDNDAVLNDPKRLERGLVNIGYTRAKVGQIRAQNIKEAALLFNHVNYTFSITAAMGREPSVNVDVIDVEDHAANAVMLHCQHNLGSINFDDVTIKGTYYLEPSIEIGTRAKGSNIGRINGRLESGQVNKSLLEYKATSSTIGAIEAYNFVANKTTNDAVLHFNSCKYSTVGNISVDASSLAGSSGGIKYTGTYNFKTDVALVNNMNHGVIDGAGNARVICVGCVALTNTTDSDLPVGNLVVDQGNFQWTV